MLAFATGVAVFYLIDRGLEAAGGRASQILAMLLDYMPEAMAIGTMMVARQNRAIVPAGLMLLQNLPFENALCVGRDHDVRCRGDPLPGLQGYRARNA